MNEPLPSAASVPVSEDEQDKGPAQEAPAPDEQAISASQDSHEVSQDDLDEDESEDDEDGEDGERRKRLQRQAAAAEPAPPPVSFADVVSGQFDQQADAAEAAPSKRVLAPQPETPKLHKVLAQAGLGSRLEMEQLIMEGRI